MKESYGRGREAYGRGRTLIEGVCARRENQVVMLFGESSLSWPVIVFRAFFEILWENCQFRCRRRSFFPNTRIHRQHAAVWQQALSEYQCLLSPCLHFPFPFFNACLSDFLSLCLSFTQDITRTRRCTTRPRDH